jgi:hypothetical protein
MNRMCRLLSLATWAMSLSGCMTYTAAVKSHQGKAYLVHAKLSGSTLWNCDATSGEPVCYRVTEVPLARP